MTKLLPAIILILAMSEAVAGKIVVIGDPGISRLDAVAIQKIFTGKLIKIGGIDVTAVNIAQGPLRDKFLQTYLNQSDDKYSAYWAMRMFVGKGAPPLELKNTSEIIKFVQSTPGAIGYIDEGELTPDLHVIAR